MTNNRSVVMMAMAAAAVAAADSASLPAGAQWGTGKTLAVHLKSGRASDAGPVHAANMALALANEMQSRGHDVAVFADVDGVHAVLKNPPPPSSADARGASLGKARDLAKELLANGGRILVCPHCLAMAGFSEGDVLPGVGTSGPAKMSRLLGNASAVIDY